MNSLVASIVGAMEWAKGRSSWAEIFTKDPEIYFGQSGASIGVID